MREEYIRDFNTHRILGILRYHDNGDVDAIDFDTREILGFYKAYSNRTTDIMGFVLTEGNSIVSLIYQNDEKKHRR